MRETDEKIRGLKVRDSDNIDFGEKVYAIGNSMNYYGISISQIRNYRLRKRCCKKINQYNWSIRMYIKILRINMKRFAQMVCIQSRSKRYKLLNLFGDGKNS